MGTLLHLSDLHLAAADADGDVTGDYKVNAVLPEERQRRTSAIRNTLSQLGSALTAASVVLDAVVITGDVTVQGSQVGIELLPEVLAELGDALPPSDRILIVPGNHDVTWQTLPSSAPRYERFIALRSHGYRTAYLEGVDTDGERGLRDVTPPQEPCVVATDGSFILVGINSSDMCGVEIVAEADVLDGLAEIEKICTTSDPVGIAVKALYASWKRRGLHDIARVSAVQRKVCSVLARSKHAAITSAGQAAPVMIAAFHHQLRPVSASEEFKPFEGITNLGEVRQWLAGNRFDVLLHGHKHEERVLEDIFVPFDEGNQAPSHRLLVVSAPTIGHGQPASNSVARLITVDADMPRIADVVLALIPVRSAGVPIELSRLPTEAFTVGNDDGVRAGVLEGDTAAEVYNKIRAAENRLDALPRPLICRFDDGPSAKTLPTNYPDVGFAAESDGDEARSVKMQTWLEQTVEWWDRPTRGVAAPFNHGERIKGRLGSDASQFEAAINSLRSNNRSSRAVILLINPATDFDDSNTAFPAFALVQMLARDGALTMTGYFRKQEMPHWWPINVAELASLQQNAIEELRSRGTILTAGSICTITAMPVAGDSAPRVVIPDIDRRVEAPGEFLELLIPLYFGGTAADEVVHRWNGIIDDWRPTEHIAADGDPVPVLGFTQLVAIAEACHALRSSDVDPTLGERLIVQLKQLRDTNDRYSQEQGGADRVLRHQQWRSSIDGLVKQMLDTVSEMASAAAG